MLLREDGKFAREHKTRSTEKHEIGVLQRSGKDVRNVYRV